MTTTPSSEARAEARAEAERRYPAPDFPGDNIGLRFGFVEGAEWKGAQGRELYEAASALQLEDDTGLWCYLCDSMVMVCECPAARFRDALRALSGVESSDEGEG